MKLVPKREYLVLLTGDLVVLAVSLWVTLGLRYLAVPSKVLLSIHILPFSILFVVWVSVFFLAGLYGRQTHLFRSKLLPAIISAQIINVILAALFFFLIPTFGLAPKTILLLYLIVSSALIFLWRISVFPRIRIGKKLRGVLIASGPDAAKLAEEVRHDRRYSFVFEYVIDAKAPTHEVIQHACRVVEEDGLEFLVIDFSEPALATILPIVYDAAFQKRRFALIDVAELYQEVFDRVPLSFVSYQWVLSNLASSKTYDGLKRVLDAFLALFAGVLSLFVYPFVMLAIKLDDGGTIFIRQQRVGRYQKPIYVLKFRSMSGEDKGETAIKSNLVVTRVGRVMRRLRIDELPQLWNILKGDLSFVGPRPELPALAEHYNARIPYYSARYLITPGLTGWAQIWHDRHPHHEMAVAETKEKLSYDLYYFHHRSLILDLYILLQTVRIVLTAKGS